ncbi:MAG: hypothetical protein JWN44_1866 [Myxococcales bacterium]|nr:hypothetical protein [Myxococcales bacterium]
MVKTATLPDAATPAQWRTRADEDRAPIVGIVRPVGELIALCVGAVLLYRWLRARRRSRLP